jgi:ribosomal protein L37E
MNKENLNIFEHTNKETSDSCPHCGNPLVLKPEEKIKICIAESFDVSSNTVIPCGYTKSL